MSAPPLAATAAHAQWRAALRNWVANEPALAALLGGSATIHDETPRGESRPVLVFGTTLLRDRSGQDTVLIEHRLDIEIWSPSGTSRPALEILETIAARLPGASLTMPAHRLVGLSVAEIAFEREGRAQRIRGRLRLTALTQPLSPVS